jgi:hypothetical protein
MVPQATLDSITALLRTSNADQAGLDAEEILVLLYARCGPWTLLFFIAKLLQLDSMTDETSPEAQRLLARGGIEVCKLAIEFLKDHQALLEKRAS